MVDLPHRFVPTTSKFVSPVRIVSQYGHGAAVTALSFSPCLRFFASLDADGWLRIWMLETLDIVGIYLLDDAHAALEWEGTHALVCRMSSGERRIEFAEEAQDAPATDAPVDDVSSRIIPLIGLPEVTREGDIVRISYMGDIFEHEVPGMTDMFTEPCERYVAAFSEHSIHALSLYEDKEFASMNAPESHKWLGLAFSFRGDVMYALCDDASIYACEVLKGKTDRVLAMNTQVTAHAFGGSKYVVFGSRLGNIVIYDLEAGSLLLQTPRAPRGFSFVFPTPDKPGLMALRPESATAFFAQSQEILSSSPLPAPCVAACAGTGFSEMIVACADSAVYRIRLDNGALVKLFLAPQLVTQLAVSGENVIVSDSADDIYFYDGELRRLDLKCPGIRRLALSESADRFAVLTDDSVTFYARDRVEDKLSVDLQGAAAIAFGKEKTAGTLFAFMRDLTVRAIDSKTGEIRDLCALCLARGRILSVAPAAKSFVFVLAETEHGQLVTLKVGLNSGKSSELLRVFAYGTQIYGASNGEQSVCLRSDASSLRIVSGLKAFSIDDWVRSEPLAIF
ncbi:MAG: hypothetical protein IKY83_01530 [Proteobacteria bacterium]|nr:hypothetical protein [Pseudomonadota bacterium]